MNLKIKMSNEELVGASDDAINTINLAISELEGIEEFENALEILEEAKKEIIEASEDIREAYKEECEKEREYENFEYERSVL